MLEDEAGAEVARAARILDERARGLARPFGSPGPEGDVHLIARVGGRRVALPMAALRAVVPTPPITRLPSGGSLIGVVALAGEVVPVADLASLLDSDVPTSEIGELLVVVDDGDSRLALQVDAVEGHETFRPPSSPRIDLSDSAVGPERMLTTPVGHDDLVVLDIDAALGDARLALPGPISGPGKEGAR